MDASICKKLKEFGSVKNNVNIAKFTTFKIGGSASCYLEITERQKLVEALNYLNGEGVEYIILGGGSNILFPDEVLERVVVRIKTSELKREGDEFVADSGVSFSFLTNLALKESMSGLEWSAGLPGTVGGAIRGNAGAAGGETARVLSKVEVLSDGEVKILSSAECGFGYRESIFKHNSDVILRGWFKLQPGEPKESIKTMQDILKKRAGYYPKFPSAGSFFKNIPVSNWKQENGELPEQFRKTGMIPAGWLNEMAGLKGRKIGGAMVSNEHGNFLINFENASQTDLLKLVEEVKTTVYNKFHIELTEEVQIIR